MTVRDGTATRLRCSIPAARMFAGDDLTRDAALAVAGTLRVETV
jgi:hypothetical protein